MRFHSVRLNPIVLKRFFWTLAAVSVATASGVFLLAAKEFELIWNPSGDSVLLAAAADANDAEAVTASLPTSGASEAEDKAARSPSLDAFRGVWDQALRRPLYDPPPPVPPPPAPPPPLRINLLATMTSPTPADGSEADASALATDAQGQIHTLLVGQMIDNARVEAIGDGTITVRYFDQPQVLQVQR